LNLHYPKTPKFHLSHLHLTCLKSLQNPLCLKNLRYRLFPKNL
jgi:hypothetical protein